MVGYSKDYADFAQEKVYEGRRERWKQRLDRKKYKKLLKEKDKDSCGASCSRLSRDMKEAKKPV